MMQTMRRQGMEHRTRSFTATTAMGLVISAFVALGSASNVAAQVPDRAVGATDEQAAHPAAPVLHEPLPAREAVPIGPHYDYTFTINSFKITNTRSVHNDTDYLSMAVVVGNNPPITVPVKSLGDVNNGVHAVNLSIPNVGDPGGQRVAFSYSIVNSGHASDTFEQALSALVSAAATKAAEAGGGALAGPAGEAVGSGAGAWAIGKLLGIIFADCDGPVAAGDHTYSAAELAAGANGKVVTTTDDNKGTDSPTGCGSNSQYYVTWSVQGNAIAPANER